MRASELYLEQYRQKLLLEFGDGSTVKNYCGVLHAFFTFSIGKQGSPAELLSDYLEQVETKEPTTLNLHRSAIVKFFSAVKGVEITKEDVPRRKAFKKTPKIIDIKDILAAVEQTKNLKHRLVLMLFFGCGLRLSEVRYLRKKNVMPKVNRLWLQKTKGNKYRYVSIPETLQVLLYEHIKYLGEGDFVFSCSGAPYSARSIQNIVKDAFSRVGVDAHPHLLRHCFATYQLIAGKNIYEVMNLMGHSSLKTTEIYLHAAQKMQIESVDLLCANAK
jgi:integrase